MKAIVRLIGLGCCAGVLQTGAFALTADGDGFFPVVVQVVEGDYGRPIEGAVVTLENPGEFVETEYAMSVGMQDGGQPFVTIRWWLIEAGGPSQEYAEAWRKGMQFGRGKRFVAEKLTGCDFDGKKKAGEVAELVVLDTVTKERRTFRSDDPKFTFWRNSSQEWLKAWEAKEEKRKRGEGEVGE